MAQQFKPTTPQPAPKPATTVPADPVRHLAERIYAELVTAPAGGGRTYEFHAKAAITAAREFYRVLDTQPTDGE